MIYTLMSSDVHRILSTEPERSAVGEHGRSQTASGASILQDGQSVCRRPTALEPDRPGTATECSLCAPTTADGPRPKAVQITTADISRLAEARLITEGDIRSDVVRIRNGYAPAADGAIAVGRATQNGRF
jgi:hypothetical protein